MSMDAWIVAGCGVIGVLAQVFVSGTKLGAHSQQLDSHERRLNIVEPIVHEHTQQIGVLEGRHERELT